MVEYKQQAGDATPIPLEKFDITGSLLQDNGITEILPIIAESFPNMN